MADYFRGNSGKLSLRILSAPNNGFRPGQVGALHAVVSHFSVYDEPAIISLPTGYGKTAVMMAVPFILGTNRVLVVEPSDALRKQSASHFKTLSVLRKLNVLELGIPDPKVVGQKGRPASLTEWEDLGAYDVVISTPQSSSPSTSPAPSSDLFDLVIFDEAHHAPAETWKAYLDHFKGARFVFLTATPFRRDRKIIPGRLAYSYPVSKASQERAFGKVHFRAAIVANDRDEGEVDRAVAKAAVDQLRKDRADGFDHRIFARASTIRSADALVGVYTAEGAKVQAIASHQSKTSQDKTEAALIDGSLDGIVCVDMFGEGYDFPRLKIAALHAPHRSLVPTLQFIGRFARTTGSATGDATLIAPLSRLKDATASLFREGVDIGQLIDATAQAQISAVETNREILDVLKIRQQSASDYDAVSPLSLELFAHARIYRCSIPPDFSKFGAIVAKKLRLAKQWTSDDDLITLLLTVDLEPPNWATSDVLINVRHDAFLLAYNEAAKLCFVGSTRRTERLYLDLMETVCEGKHRPLSYEETRRAVAGLDDLRFYNVGLKNTAINTQAESYRVLTGPRAELAVTAGDARAFVQGHFYGSGALAGSRETVGASSRSRIWSNRRLTVAEYLDWVSVINKRLNGSEKIAPSQLDLVQPTKVLSRLPEHVIGGAWDKVAYRMAPRIRHRAQQDANWSFGQITDYELSSFSVSNDRQSMHFSIAGDGGASFPFVFSLAGGQLFEAAKGDWQLEVLSGYDDWTDMKSWLNIHPPAFFGADKSSFQGVNAMAAPSNTISRLAPDDAKSLDWTGCDITKEFGPASAAGKLTVHDFLERYLLAGGGLTTLIYDHRSGEAADFISVKVEQDGTTIVSLYHCKGAGGAPDGTRVGDVYEVACQMLKSVAYCDASILIEHIEHRTNLGRHKSPSRFVVGDLDAFKSALTAAPANKLRFEIYGVQPGISNSAIDEHLADLMAFGIDYVQRGGAAKGAWLING